MAAGCSAQKMPHWLQKLFAPPPEWFSNAPPECIPASMQFNGDFELARTHGEAQARAIQVQQGRESEGLWVRKLGVEHGVLYLILCPEEKGGAG